MSTDPSTFLNGELAIETQPEQPLCMHFVNTVSNQSASPAYDHFDTFGSFIAWCALAGLIHESEFSAALRREHRNATTAAEMLESARSLRRSLFHIFAGLSRGMRVHSGDVGIVNDVLDDQEMRPYLRFGGGRAEMLWRHPAGLQGALSRVALSAATTLTALGDRRIVRCANPECDWLALDTSRNRSKRYCSAAGCGNRARARRFYARNSPPAR